GRAGHRANRKSVPAREDLLVAAGMDAPLARSEQLAACALEQSRARCLLVVLALVLVLGLGLVLHLGPGARGGPLDRLDDLQMPGLVAAMRILEVRGPVEAV